MMLSAASACTGGSERPPRTESTRPPAPPPIVLPTKPGAADAPPPRLLCAAPAYPTPLEIDGDPAWACADLAGKRHGPFFALYPDGSTEIAGTYRDGLLDGEWRRMFRNGKTAEVGNYVAGKKDGTWQLYTDQGGLLGDYHMAAGTGVEQRWYFDGQLASERHFRNGVLDGQSLVYGDGGAVLYSAQFHRGALDGTRRVGVAGALRLEDQWAAGHPVSARKIWRHETLTLDMTFDDEGEPTGVFTAWRSHATLRERGTYLRGDRHGVWRWYGRGGELEREGSYFLGLRHGTWRQWSGGHLTMQGKYAKGRPQGVFTFWTSSGGVAGTCNMRNGTGTMPTYYDSGLTATKLDMVRGLRHGVYQELTPRGKVVVEGSYVNDQRDGPWLEFDGDGAVVREAHYTEGKLEGVVRRYRDGHLIAEAGYAGGQREGAYRELKVSGDGKGDVEAVSGSFHADRKSGEWIYRRDDGSPSLVANYKNGVLQGPWRQLAGEKVVVRGQHEAGRRTGTWSWAASEPGSTLTYGSP
jgi:uncharacterized protein